jgi:hypothetical protein
MNHEIKLGLQNYASIIPIENSYIKFYNNKVNNLQRYDISQNHIILHKVVQVGGKRERDGG